MDKDAPADNAGMHQKKQRDEESARRFRAAFGWAGLNGPGPISKAMGVSDTTAKRLAKGEGVYNAELWNTVLKLTSVPVWFIEHGWDGANVPDDIGVGERVEALESQVEALYKLLGARLIATLPPAGERPEGRAGPAGGPPPGPPD
jgi:hypothetical protein